MKSIFAVACMVIALFASSCVDKRMHYTSLLEEADKFIDVAPDSSLFFLLEIADPEKLNASQKADYGYLISRIHYKQGKAMADDSLVLYTLDYYKENSKTENLAIVYLLAANYYKWRDDMRNFRNTIEEGIEFGIGNGDSVIVAMMYSRYAGMEAQNNNYLHAIELLHNAMKYNMEAPQYIYGTGLYFSRIEQVDSADYYFKKSMDFVIGKGLVWDTNFIRRNYADQLTSEGRYKEALTLLYDNIRENADTAHLSIARNYIELREMDSAQYYINELTNKGIKLHSSATNILMTLQAVLNYARNEPIDWSKHGQFNDSLVIKSSEDQKLLEEKITIKNQLQQRNLTLTIEKQRMQLYITWGILFFSIAALTIVLYIRRKKKLLTEAIERQEVMENILKEASEMNDEKNRFAKKVILQQLGLIRIVANTPTSQNQKLLKQVSLIDNKNENADNILVWDDFYKVIDSLYDDFYSKTVSEFGKVLIEKEIQLCCLLRADFSTKEISVLTGQKMQTIYQRKTTVRQKLGMDEKDDIAGFISGIIPAFDTI